MNLGSILDGYSVRARLFPAVISFAPIIVGAAAWFPNGIIGFTGALGTFVLGVTSLMMANLVRDQGKALEPRLFQSWGGMPSIAILRHEDKTLNTESKKRCSELLVKSISGLVWPSRRKERANPEGADEVYESCCLFLRERTRDAKRFPLVFEENVNYGFRRNLLAMKSCGMATAILGTVSASAAIPIFSGSERTLAGAAILPLTINAAFCVFWLFRVNSRWVRQAAYDYAQRLVLSVQELDAGTGRSGKE